MKPIFKMLDNLRRKKKLFPFEIPDLHLAVGKTVTINDEQITINHITGNISKVYMAEINGTHLISFLDLFGQLSGEPASPEDIKAFNEIDMQMIPTKKKGLKRDLQN